MYEDSKNNRVLLKTGESIVAPFEYARKILLDDLFDSCYVLTDEDSDTYKLYTGKDISIDEENIKDPVPETKDYIKQGDIVDQVMEYTNQDRLKYCEENFEEVYERVEDEVEYFVRTENMWFVLEICKMIEQFKKDGTVWGVGRGSSCASLLMYLLDVNDINPLEYDIPFHELSKEIQE